MNIIKHVIALSVIAAATVAIAATNHNTSTASQKKVPTFDLSLKPTLEYAGEGTMGYIADHSVRVKNPKVIGDVRIGDTYAQFVETTFLDKTPDGASVPSHVVAMLVMPKAKADAMVTKKYFENCTLVEEGSKIDLNLRSIDNPLLQLVASKVGNKTSMFRCSDKPEQYAVTY